ncbi:uncharacterized protein [Epargyreus clarus]|uniref:uncharacterized protein n=1 Tax=Epargyreus clarus TaxID=520877 RepID=UPI003C2E169D
MGSDMKTRLQNISRYLNEFENKPKKIEGNLIPEWFNVGERLFEEFYHLGTCVKWNSSTVKTQNETSDIVSRVTKNQDWLQSFITIYPGLRIDLEGATAAVDVCRVRSGIEFLLKGFTGINKPFDNVINDLKRLGELEEFDEHLKVWAQSHRPDFFSGDLHRDTPKSHWWWF